MSNTERLDGIEARLSAAPLDAGWYVGDDGAVWVAHDPEHASCSGVTGRLPVWGDGAAELIAHAPTDLAALVAVVREVDALHTEDEVCGCGKTHCKHCEHLWPCPTAAAVQKLGGGS